MSRGGLARGLGGGGGLGIREGVEGGDAGRKAARRQGGHLATRDDPISIVRW